LSCWRGVFRWGESQQLIPPGTYAALLPVRGLEHGQAREMEPVAPVDEDVLAQALPHLNAVARTAVELLALTAARPGELLKLTPADLDRSGVVEVARNLRVRLGEDCWGSQPFKHKTSHRGRRRIILSGPRSQTLLAPLLEGRAPDAPLFSAAEGEEDRRRRLRAARKTRVPASQQHRRKAAPLRMPG